MKQVIALVMAIILLSQPVWAGGSNRVGAIGTGDIGLGANPDGPYFSHNLADRQDIEESSWKSGCEFLSPRLTFKDSLGRKEKSKSMLYVLPFFSYSRRLTDGLVFSVDSNTANGFGSSFRHNSNQWGFDTETLASLTNVTPSLCLQLTDKLSIGCGPVIAMSKLKWRAPLDINRYPLPLLTSTKAWGWGMGGKFSAYYQVNDQWAVGANYTTAINTDMRGRSQIFLGPIMLTDHIRLRDYNFPDRLDLEVAYKPAPNWLIVGDWSWYGYSQNSPNQAVLSFQRLKFSKGVKLNWGDDYGLRLAASRKFSNGWTLGAGFGYMSKAVPNANIDTLTPDTSGWSIAGQVGYAYKDCMLNLSVTDCWGSFSGNGNELRTKAITYAASFQIKF